MKYIIWQPGQKVRYTKYIRLSRPVKWQGVLTIVDVYGRDNYSVTNEQGNGPLDEHGWQLEAVAEVQE